MTRQEKVTYLRGVHRRARKLLGLTKVPITIVFREVDGDYGTTDETDSTTSRFVHAFNLDKHATHEEIADTVIHELLEVHMTPLINAYEACIDDERLQKVVEQIKERVIGQIALALIPSVIDG